VQKFISHYSDPLTPQPPLPEWERGSKNLKRYSLDGRGVREEGRG